MHPYVAHFAAKHHDSIPLMNANAKGHNLKELYRLSFLITFLVGTLYSIGRVQVLY